MLKDRPKAICLLGATFNTNNMGVSALTDGTIQCILRQFPEVEIYLLNYGKKLQTYYYKTQNGDIAIQLYNMRFSKKLFQKNNIAVLILLSLILKIIPFTFLKDHIIAKHVRLRKIIESDFCTSIAGGDSFSDIYGIKRFLYVSLPQLLVLLLHKKLVLLPQTIGPFNRKILRVLAKYILNRASVIYLRNSNELNEIKELVNSPKMLNEYNKVRFCYDVGFVVKPVKPFKMEFNGPLRKRTSESGLIGLNVSGLLFAGKYTRSNMFGLRLDYEKLIHELITFLVEEKKTSILLVPHVFGGKEHFQSDFTACEAIYNELMEKYKDSLFCLREKYNQNEIKYIIGLCEFFIGSRMHACIAAISQNIPTVGIAYSKKFYGVFETVGLESLVVDPRKLEREEMFKIINEGYDQRDLIRKRLETRMPIVKEAVLNLFKEIYTIVS